MKSHTPHSPLPTTRTVVLITRGYELDPRSKSRVAAIQIGSFLARVRAVIVVVFVNLQKERSEVCGQGPRSEVYANILIRKKGTGPRSPEGPPTSSLDILPHAHVVRNVADDSSSYMYSRAALSTWQCV